MTKRPPISDKVPGLRQRQRADGSWRLWWEPSGSARALGFDPVELDENRLSWSARRARELTDLVARKRRGEATAPVGAAGRTMSALIHAYLQGDDFREKRTATQASYRRNLAIIDEKWGAFAVPAFTKPIMHEWYQACRRTRGDTQAVRLLGMCSILFGFAELKGWRAENSNPCAKLKMKIPSPRQRVASWAELDALLDAAHEQGLPSVGTAALLSALQGQRQTDILAATCDAFSQVTVPAAGQAQQTVWAWRVDRSKRGTLGLMQVHPIVLDRVLPLIADRPGDAPLLIEERTGHRYDTFLFQSRWSEVREAAARHCPSLTGADVLQFRDLRRSFSVWAKAGGAGNEDVGDVLGNSAALDPRLEETYMPSTFATASRAVLSIARPDPSERKKA